MIKKILPRSTNSNNIVKAYNILTLYISFQWYATARSIFPYYT